MVQILVLLLVVSLAVRGATYLYHAVSAHLLRGKRFDRMVREERVDQEIIDEARRVRVDRTIRSIKEHRLTREQRAQVKAAEVEERREYLANFRIGGYQLVYIFFVASVLGLLLEEAWMYLNFGIRESRVGMVWGPFSPLYGFGACLLTVVLWRLRERPPLYGFLASAFLGTVLEQCTGMAMQYVAHATSWDYSALPDHITQWTAWRFVLVWGLLGLVWVRVVLPELLYRIGRACAGRGRFAVVCLLATFLVADAFVTVSCFSRNAAREEGIPPQNAFESWIDEHYDEQFIESRFQNLALEDASGGQAS